MSETLTNSTILEVSKVSFSYPETSTLVLDDLSLNMQAGTVLCLMGVNGCGKSTFLDCVLGANHINSGTLKIMGQDIARLKVQELAKMLAYVPQEHQHTFPYSVEHVVQMGRTVHLGSLGTPDAHDRELVQDALQLCGISHLSARPYTSLSGGEMQMTMLARALVQDAPIIVMDEPTVHLDFRNELIFLQTMIGLLTSKNLSVIMATHSPNQTFFLANAGLDVKIALMDKGSIHVLDTPQKVLTPKTLRELFGIEALLLSQDYIINQKPGHATQIASIAIAEEQR